MTLERKDVAVQRNGVVHVKKTGEHIGVIEEVLIYGVPRRAWMINPSGAIQWWSYREQAVAELVRTGQHR